MAVFNTTGTVKQPTVSGVAASPNLGNGGADYNTAEAALKKKIAQNQLNIKNNNGYAQNEISRTLQVIQNRQSAGQDTSAQQKYLNTNLGYKAPTANVNSTSSSVISPTSTKTNNSQSSELMDLMRSYLDREQNTFSYDPNSDPAYQAALKRAGANIEAGNSQAQAEMNRRGILNSTITSDRMGEISSNEMGRVETEIVPQLMQQAYQKYIDAQNQEQQKFANMGSMAQMYTSEDQRAIDNTNTTAGLTGYLPFSSEAQTAINNIIQLKQQAETKGISAVDKAKLSAQADGYRAQLVSLGVDPSAYSKAVNSTSASKNSNMGIRTLAGQTLDSNNQAQTFNQNLQTRQQDFSEGQQGWQNNFQNRQQNFNESQQKWQNNFATEQQAYTAARAAISDSQWKAQFDQSVSQFGLNYALSQLQENNQQSYREAQIALSQDDSSRQWAALDYDMSKPTGAVDSGLSSNQILDSMRSLYTEPIMTTDKFGTQTKTGEKLTTDVKKREQMFLNVVDSGKSDAETKQILSALGLTKKEIETFTKNNTLGN
jgi:hypothetical protein